MKNLVFFLLIVFYGITYSNSSEFEEVDYYKDNIYYGDCINIKYNTELFCVSSILFGSPFNYLDDETYLPDKTIRKKLFRYLNFNGEDSYIGLIYYDSFNKYLIIELNKTFYHYCDVPKDIFNNLNNIHDVNSYYENNIYGKFDCRKSLVPDYTKITKNLIFEEIELRINKVYEIFIPLLIFIFVFGVCVLWTYIYSENKKLKILKIFGFFCLCFLLLHIYLFLQTYSIRNAKNNINDSNDIEFIKAKYNKIIYDLYPPESESDYEIDYPDSYVHER